MELIEVLKKYFILSLQVSGYQNTEKERERKRERERQRDRETDRQKDREDVSTHPTSQKLGLGLGRAGLDLG